jgi:hypothetical protein
MKQNTVTGNCGYLTSTDCKKLLSLEDQGANTKN